MLAVEGDETREATEDAISEGARTDRVSAKRIVALWASSRSPGRLDDLPPAHD